MRRSRTPSPKASAPTKAGKNTNASTWHSTPSTPRATTATRKSGAPATWADQQRAPHGNDSVLGRARIHLAKLLRSLPRRSYTDIAIRPFQLTLDGVRFGLVIRKEDGETWAELYPDRLEFGEPWDGRYVT